MSSKHLAKSESDSTASELPSVPIGVRTPAVVAGHWIGAALVAALALAGLMFFVLPAWVAPARNETPPPAAASPPAPTQQVPVGDQGDAARSRLLAEERASRFREKRDGLQQQGAPLWAAEAWAAAIARGDEAAAAISARDFARAIDLYEDATRRLVEVSGGAEPAFRQALAAGNAAIEARASSDAVKAFQIALAIRPGDRIARQGLDRARRLDEVLAHFAAGEAQEKAGARAKARREYAAAAAIDSEFAPARAALNRIDGQLGAERFNEVMTRGMAELERRDWSGAERSFRTALKMRPAHPAAADGLARAQQSSQRESLARLQREAQALESSERWEEALASYRRAAAIDPAVDFAREGVARCNRMIALHARVASYLAEPERLYSENVRGDANQFLASLGSEAAGPRFKQERHRLEEALRRATTKITVQLASDNATEVTLYRVGRLGRFQNREIALTPGTYTLVGSRPGYKDVRVQLIVSPDSNAPRAFVACEERV